MGAVIRIGEYPIPFHTFVERMCEICDEKCNECTVETLKERFDMILLPGINYIDKDKLIGDEWLLFVLNCGISPDDYCDVIYDDDVD